MAEGETRSLHQIKRETEATRAGLTNTVEQLRSTVTDTAADIRDRLRPEAIKAEVSDYFKSRGEQLLSDVKEAARRNPMQAVAVGASVAYPLLRVARAIPVPILMIGAGLFFAGSKTGRDLTQQASDKASDLADVARQRTQDLSGQVAKTAADARDYASSALNRVTGAVSDGAEQFRKSGDTPSISRPGVTSNLQTAREATEAVKRSVTTGVSNLQDRATAFASDTSNSIQAKISDVSSTLGQSVTDGKQAGQEFLTNTRDRVSDVSQRASQAMSDTIAQNPLLVVGVGLLLGGLIASALPKFQVEDSVMGGASTAVKKRAQEAAAHGVEAAKGAADEIIDKVAQQARAEGLTPDGLASGAQEVSQRVQRVAERAVTTAFELDTENHAQGNGEHHG
jgi:ElaB/YqjD/DUF883 family membrane-anchored ribosome-binding protein